MEGQPGHQHHSGLSCTAVKFCSCQMRSRTSAVTSRCKWTFIRIIKKSVLGGSGSAAGCCHQKSEPCSWLCYVLPPVAGWLYRALQQFFSRRGRESIYLRVPNSDESFNCLLLCPFSLVKKHLEAR